MLLGGLSGRAEEPLVARPSTHVGGAEDPDHAQGPAANHRGLGGREAPLKVEVRVLDRALAAPVDVYGCRAGGTDAMKSMQKHVKAC